jgi:oligopeptide/dipeptide ABC transporter ATP-binding protein
MLDVSVRAGIMRLLTDLRRERSMTLILVTHDLSLAWASADRVAVMYLGRVVEVGSARDVIRSPAHPYTEALVSAVPILDPTAPPVSVHLRTTPPLDPVGGSSCPFQPRCLYAKPRCAQDQPELREIDSRHLAACVRTEEIRDVLRDAAQTHLSSSLETARTGD